MKHNNFFRKHKIAFIVTVAVVLTAAAVATSFAILKATGKVTNIFEKQTQSISLEETFNGIEKKDVYVKNEGTYAIYVRASVVLTWVNASGEAYYKAPASSDVTVTYGTAKGWFTADDGYWYYSSKVEAGQSTADLIKSCKLATGATVPTGYKLNVDVISQTIQADATALANAWGSAVTVDTDGKLVD